MVRELKLGKIIRLGRCPYEVKKGKKGKIVLEPVKRTCKVSLKKAQRLGIIK